MAHDYALYIICTPLVSEICGSPRSVDGQRMANGCLDLFGRASGGSGPKGNSGPSQLHLPRIYCYLLPVTDI